MYRIKNRIVIFIVFLPFICICQINKQEVYLYFDETSPETYLVEVNGRMVKEKFYTKGVNKNGNVTFYMGREMLLFNKKNNKIDSCRIEHLENIKMSNIGTLIKKVNKTNAFYPYKVYPNLILIEKINDSIIAKYKVKWEYYIE